MKNIKSGMTIKKGILIFVALFAVFYTIIYVVPTVSDIFKQTYIAEYGTLDSSHEAECIIVRDESVYKADSSGSVEQVVAEGELVKAGSHIVSVGGRAVYNEEIGLVSYHYDGYESSINSENIEKLSETFFDEFNDKQDVHKTVVGSAESGDVVFKIIDRTKWYIVFWMDKEDAEIFEEGTNVLVDFGKNEEVQMSVFSMVKDGSKTKVVLSCNRIYEEFDEHRIVKCVITTRSSNGIIINTDSIVEKDGVQGVYVVDKYGKENFRPIQIYSTRGNKTVVAKNYFYDNEGYSVETVKNYDEILKQTTE